MTGFRYDNHFMNCDSQIRFGIFDSFQIQHKPWYIGNKIHLIIQTAGWDGRKKSVTPAGICLNSIRRSQVESNSKISNSQARVSDCLIGVMS